MFNHLISNCPSLSDLLNLKATTFLLYTISIYLFITIASFLFNTLKSYSLESKFLKIALRKRSQRDSQIKSLTIPSLNLPPSLTSKILNSDATTLLDLLTKGEVTSEQILITYAQRAFTIGLDLELITEIDFNEALTQARKCDKLRKENPSACKGLLFGLPMSIKDCFHLKGTDASGGVACKVFLPSKEDGLLIKILKGEGAIPFVKSNVPQAMMTVESKNYIWGCAKNPWNKGRGVGGSSGGEGALIAARCAPMGLGNDVGGSIRLPALYCGVVGFKPMSERLTNIGEMFVAPTINCIPNMTTATGPIVKSVRDVNLMMKAFLNGETHKNAKLSERDPINNIRPWQEELVFHKPKGMRIGYVKNMEFFPAAPPVLRAVDEAAEALRRRGYEVFEVKFPNLEELTDMYFEIVAAEGDAAFLKDGLQGEKLIPEYVMLAMAAKLPNGIRGVVKLVLKALGEQRSARLVDKTRKKNAYEFIKLAYRQMLARKEFCRVWEENRMDGLLMPGFAFPAIKLGFADELAVGACYSFIFNVLNFPCGTLPVTVVKEGEDCYPKESAGWTDSLYKKTVESMKGSVGLPVAVQLITLPWAEEKCVGIMMQLEEEVQFAKKHPLPEL